MRGLGCIGGRGCVCDRGTGDNGRHPSKEGVTRAVNEGVELLGLGFEPCVKGVGVVCGNTTVG